MVEMPLSYLDRVQPKSKLAIWAWSPIIVLRVALVSTYIGFVYAAVVAFLVGVPLFTLTTPPGWTPIWAALLGLSSLLAAVGSLADRWQKVEKWAGLILVGCHLAYVIGMGIVAFFEHDLSRQYVFIISLIAGILPVARFVYLAAQTGKKKVRPHVPLG